MLFKFAILSATLAGTSAAPVNRLGANVLSRNLEQNAEADYSWMIDYDIQFGSCHTIPSFGSDEEAADGEDIGTLHGKQTLVTYNICPGGKCKKGGEYVIGMPEFLETFVASKFEKEEANCEAVAENCACNDDGDDASCLAACYKSAGYDYCEKDEDFDVAQYFECVEAPFSDGNYYSSTFYIGPRCSKDGDDIYLDLFKDAKCSKEASSGDYYKYSGGYTLPYSSESMVDDDFYSCEDPDEVYYNGAYQSSGEVLEMCAMIYAESGKCEKDMKGKYSKDNESCQFINKILPALEGVNKHSGRGPAYSWAWVFFGTTIAASCAAVYATTMAKRSTVDLSAKSAGGYM